MSLSDKFKRTKESVLKATNELDELLQTVQKIRDEFKEDIIRKTETIQFSQFDKDKIEDFFDEPYVVVPKRKDEWYVIAPKFVNFQIGWLEKSTKSFNVFVINKYMSWLAEVPERLKQKFKFRPPLPLKVYDGMLLTGKQHQEEAWRRYKKHLRQRQGRDKIAIKRGHEFNLIASMIDDGILPFIPRPVVDKDLLENPVVKFSLRSYQSEAREKFLKYGAIGVYWAFGSGKTFLGLHELAEVRVGDLPNLIVSPTRTLKEQWAERLENLIVPATEVWNETYYAFDKLRNREFGLVIFDECHRLPANTFSRLATLKTKYRIGLSATPYREDGRTNYIFALTGFPIGMDWNTLLELGVFEKPDVFLYLVSNQQAKFRKLAELLQDARKTLIFCDSIDLGNRISKTFNIPFVYGDTRNRMDVIRESETTVVSRVGDEGLSIPDIERVIEVDFLFGSRRQEGQRVGRLFHGKRKGEHYILMTDEEFEKYEKRLYALYEKGFKINITRGD